MGRAKLQLELISNEKARRMTYENRKKGLVKKAKELSTLCGVDLCMILYGPSRNNGAMEQIIWPRNEDQVANLIDSYMSRSIDDGRYRTYDLSAFFKDQTDKIEEELKKLSKKNREVKYPKWDERFNSLSQEQLKEFVSMLTAKIDTAKARINFLKSRRILLTESGVFANPSVQENTVFIPRMLNTTFDQPLTYDAQPFMENQRRMMMLMINNGPSCSNNAYGTYDENCGNYMHNRGENQIQNCALWNPIMENAGFTNADPLMVLSTANEWRDYKERLDFLTRIHS